MKNLKAIFKIIIISMLFFNTFKIAASKNLENYSGAESYSNYFSGILSIKNHDYEKSYSFFKKLNGLEHGHYIFSHYYQYSLITLNKFDEAIVYSKKLEKKDLDNFESNLISSIYYLEKNNFKKASRYITKLSAGSSNESIKILLAATLKNWISFNNIKDIDIALQKNEKISERFESVKKIQRSLINCYYDSPNTAKEFNKLIFDSKIDYSRYYFFYVNYLVSKGETTKAKSIINSSLKQFPRNLILNQTSLDLEGKKLTNKFDCSNISNVVAELLYVFANALSAQRNYTASNFYLNLAKYLNPNFVSFDALYAENSYAIKNYEMSLKKYYKLKNGGTIYNWHASKQIASILINQKKTEEAIKLLDKSFKKINNPNFLHTYEFAEFLKNREKYEDAVVLYSKVLSQIDNKHFLYALASEGRGIAYERLNQWNKAETDLLNSLSAAPNQAYVINYLAYSWIEKGLNINKSLEMLKKANELKPNDGYIIDSLGWALFKLKNYKEAKKYLETAIMFMVSDPVVNDHYADALWMNNNNLQARYYWKYVLSLESIDDKLRKNVEEKLLFGLKS